MTTEAPEPSAFGPRPGWLRRGEVKRQVEALTARLVKRPADLGFTWEGVEKDGGRSKASALVMMLESDNPGAREEAAQVVYTALLDVGERDQPGWWATDLGRAVAREIGVPYPSRQVAQAVLQVTKQAVAQMVASGRLGGGPDGSISRTSLRDEAARRWPRENDVD